MKCSLLAIKARQAAGVFIFFAATPFSSSVARPGAEGAELDRARAAVARRALSLVEPSIVTIETIGGTQPEPEQQGFGPPTTRPARGRGGVRVADGPTTGLIHSPDGLILTSSFNFVRDPSIITVILTDGSRHVARLLARDTIRRLALLRIDATGLPLPAWSPDGDMAVGQYAVACGRGYGGPAPSVSVGIVSALGRRGGQVFQTDARTSPVNYGGPLIDIDGRVLGVIVPMAGAGSELAGVQWYDSGIGFAVPRETIERSIDRLARGDDIHPGKMGVLLSQVDEPRDMPPSAEPDKSPRVAIRAVATPSPAQRAGLRAGDVIAALGGAPIGGIDDLQRRVGDLEAGAEIVLTIERDGRPQEIRLTLARARDIGPSWLDPEQESPPPATQPADPPPDS